MKRALFVLLVLMSCHPVKQPKPSTSQLPCLSSEEPSCSACLQGEVESCEALVTFYQDGQKIQRSFLRAASFWKRAQPLLEERCDRGESASCERVGLAYWEGIVTKQERDKAKRYFRAAEVLANEQCENGGVEGCLQLAGLYHQEGYSSPRKESESYQRALQLGEGVAYVLFKNFWLRYHKNEQSLVSALRPRESPLFEESCQQGDLPRCVLLGAFYEDTDPKRAEEIFDQACKKQSGEACFRLAMLFSGDLSLLQRSCGLNFQGGCRALLSAKEGAESAILALQKTWERSCLQGDVAACEYLLRVNPKESQEEIKQQIARLYEEECSVGVGQSCYRWFRLDKKERSISAPEARTRTRAVLERGCTAGKSSECLLLSGFLIPKESARAIEALERGCALGSSAACQQLSSGWLWGAEAGQQKEKIQYYVCRTQELQPFLPAPNPCELPSPR
jgi:TPR repeat protein